ncbi:MAG: Tyrosine-protein kinase wzc [bacterium ADurb.Bin236]|nr:MAG: Tyrosine-protein kinase wzc [bacterium ADurb.Bin236]HPN94863.1 polysaccharide biosynthesis tyrosine autokinase [bacterium]
MHQDLSISEYWHVLLKRKWTVIFTTALFSVFSVAFALMQPPVYKTAALVRVDQQKTVMNMLSDLMRWSPGEIMSTEVEMAQGPIVLGRVAEELGMLKKNAPEEVFFPVVSALRSRVNAERVERTNMIRITVTSSDATEAARLANLIASTYKEVSAENKSQDVRASREFVEGQLEQSRAKLREAEEELREYKEINGSMSVDSETQITLERLNTFEADLLAARREKEKLKADLDLVERRRRDINIEREVGELGSPPLQRLYDTLLDTRRSITSKQNTHTEKNPEMISLRTDEAKTAAQVVSEVSKLLAVRASELSRQIETVSRTEQELASLVGRELERIPDKDLELSRLTREVNVNEELYLMLSREHKEAQIKEIGSASEVTLVSPALAPASPIKPNKQFTIVIGLALGIMLGCVAAALVESFDTSIGAVEDIERLLEAPVLAAVPRFSHALKQRDFKLPFIGSLKKQSAPEKFDHSKSLPTIFSPGSAEAEAYKHLRTNLQFDRLKENKKVYLFSSSGSQEGKSVTIANLAVTLAQSGQRTLLLGCNMRRPTEYKIFGINRKPGLSDVLIGAAPLREAVHTFADIVLGEMNWEPALKLPGIDNLDILPAGTLPPNPSELIESQRFDDLLNSLRKEYDIILIDAPPALPVTDALLLGPKADGAVLVYKLGHLPRRALIRAKKLMDGIGINVVGIVLNDVRPEFHGIAPIYYSKEYTRATEKAFDSATMPQEQVIEVNGELKET